MVQYEVVSAEVEAVELTVLLLGLSVRGDSAVLDIWRGGIFVKRLFFLAELEIVGVDGSGFILEGSGFLHVLSQ